MSFRQIMLAVPALWLMLLLGAPLAIVALIALALPSDSIPPYALGFTLDNLRLVATDPLYRDALVRSLWIAGVSTLVCLIAGFPMALAISRAPSAMAESAVAGGDAAVSLDRLPDAHQRAQRLDRPAGGRRLDRAAAEGGHRLLFTDAGDAHGACQALSIHTCRSWCCRSMRG